MTRWYDRPFRSWAAAQEEDVSTTAWSRARERVAELFGRKAPAAESRDDASDSPPVSTPDGFSFPWSRQDPAPVSVSEVDARFESVDEALPHTNGASPASAGGLDLIFPSADKPAEISGDIELIAPEPVAAPASHETELRTDTLEVERPSIIDRLLQRLKPASRTAERPPSAPAAATVIEGNPVFLYSKFKTVYSEIIRFKDQKTEYTSGFSTALMSSEASDASPEAAADAALKKLAELLELQAAEAKWMGGEIAVRYPEAQYAMAALADELFTESAWEGKAGWQPNLLETHLFKSRSADVDLFKRIDKLLKDRPNSPTSRDLARVYLLVLAAGFRGKYRVFNLNRAVADYRQRLYEFVHRGDALLLYAPERRLFAQATQHTLTGQAVSRFSSAQRWAAILVILVVSYVVAAHVAWRSAAADLSDVTGRIIATAGANGEG